jgi:glycosyltransferase involved in cell wall biosynthesis
MRVGIDASSIRAGGGVTHLIELLRSGSIEETGVERVTVWGHRALLDRIEPRPWLHLFPQTELERGLASRVLWQAARLSALAEQHADVLLVPGSLYGGRFHPVVTMSRNLLPFEPEERRRYGLSYVGARLALLERLQGRTFRRSDGVIFLTQYHLETVLGRLGKLSAATAVINHGINAQFLQPPRPQHPVSAYSEERPYRLVYTSIVDLYKHQWNVVEAVGLLRQQGYPVALELIGNGYGPALEKLRAVIAKVDPNGRFVTYAGALANAELPRRYSRADAFVFASSCETFGQALTEAMASGLPIACSRNSALPEVLGDGGAYFDPLDPKDVARCIAELIDSAERRTTLAASAYARASALAWRKCARATFAFVQQALTQWHARSQAPRTVR